MGCTASVSGMNRSRRPLLHDASFRNVTREEAINRTRASGPAGVDDDEHLATQGLLTEVNLLLSEDLDHQPKRAFRVPGTSQLMEIPSLQAFSDNHSKESGDSKESSARVEPQVRLSFSHPDMQHSYSRPYSSLKEQEGSVRNGLTEQQLRPLLVSSSNPRMAMHFQNYTPTLYHLPMPLPQKDWSQTYNIFGRSSLHSLSNNTTQYESRQRDGTVASGFSAFDRPQCELLETDRHDGASGVIPNDLMNSVLSARMDSGVNASSSSLFREADGLLATSNRPALVVFTTAGGGTHDLQASAWGGLTDCGTARTSASPNMHSIGGQSVMSINGNSSLFYRPCCRCSRIIADEELVYRCYRCDFILCDKCYGPRVPTCGHELTTFKRLTPKRFIKDSRVIWKSTDENGNKIINDYVVLKILGRGAYSKVKLVENVHTKKWFAIKILHGQDPCGNDRAKLGQFSLNVRSMNDLCREMAVMRYTDHKNIVKLHEVINDSETNKWYFIVEYCPGGPIHTLGHPCLSLDTLRTYGKDMLRGLLHMHEQFFFHRDVKPANVLIGDEGAVKLADFGTCNSMVLGDRVQGTPIFSAPEFFRDEPVSGVVADSWGFAMTLYQAAFSKLPYPMDNYLRWRSSMLSETAVPIPNDCDTDLMDLLSKMLDKNLEKRLLLQEAARHRFFSHHDKDDDEEEHMDNPFQEHFYESLNMNTSFSKTEAMRREGTHSPGTGGFPSVVRSNGHSLLGACLNGGSGGQSLWWGSAAMNTTLGDSKLCTECHHCVDDTMCTRRRVPTEDDKTALELAACKCLAMTKDAELALCDTRSLTFSDCTRKCTSRVTRLVLRDNHLGCIHHPNCSAFTNLTSVSITHNCLKAFPEVLLGVPRLEELILRSNFIETIPHTLCNATNLRLLDLHNNCITTIGVREDGESVFACTSLRYVDLTRNPITCIPGAMTTTRGLRLSIDLIPFVKTDWEAYSAATLPLSATISWRKYPPVPVQLGNCTVWIAGGALHCYPPGVIETCYAKHVIIFKHADERCPAGLHTHTTLQSYFSALYEEKVSHVDDSFSASNGVPECTGSSEASNTLTYYFVKYRSCNYKEEWNSLKDNILDRLRGTENVFVVVPPYDGKNFLMTALRDAFLSYKVDSGVLSQLQQVEAMHLDRGDVCRTKGKHIRAPRMATV